MTRDPFYQQILAGLRGQLDPELFERCAAELLRPAHPGLVPVRGGNDAGMDGAVPDVKGEPSPLICTTREDVRTNLQESLRSYRQKGGTSRKAILATSREVKGQRWRNLFTAARKLGFRLVQVYTEGGLADLLYRRPAWCRELLGLTGDPPPLSALSLGDRPTLTNTLVGRDDDLAWVRKAHGDVVLVGQPGVGKTAVLSALARSGEGLFVTTDDLSQIANGLREQRPRLLLVEDAHLHLDLLGRLRRMRRDAYGEFRIVADCWPGDRDNVARALGVTPGG
ncbi:MAG TPA: hypothetical protein VKD72_01565, partial [Gemmataceae bacterium]|nr:hypothetical protein [Gemmataceae bacterium]